MASVYLGKLCIPFSSLEEGVSTFEFSTTPMDLKAGEAHQFPGEIRVYVKVTSIGDDYLTELEVESKADCVCDRCGAHFSRQIQGEVKTLFTHDTARADEEEKGDIIGIPPGAQGIDISQDALDALALAVPAKCLCKETCLGVCAQCGTDLNQNKCTCTRDETDPRWEALKHLKTNT